MNRIALPEGNAVDIDRLVAQAHVVSGQANHAFHQELRRVHRKVKDNDVSPFDLAVGQPTAGAGLAGKVQLVYQQEIAHQQRVFHGAGGNLKSLHDKSNNKNAEDHHGEERLDAEQ